MKNILRNILGLSVIVSAIVLSAFILIWNSNRVAGSIDTESGGYYSTSTTIAVNHQKNVALLKTGSGILGSVLFTGAPKAGRISLYNATTSDVNLRTGNLATSTITLADFNAGQATSSSYVFDTTFNTGLLLVVTSDIPATSTITYK